MLNNVNNDADINKIFYHAKINKVIINCLINNVELGRERIFWVFLKKILESISNKFFSIFHIMQIFSKNLIKKKETWENY